MVDSWSSPWHCPYCGKEIKDVSDVDDDQATLKCQKCGITSKVILLDYQPCKHERKIYIEENHNVARCQICDKWLHLEGGTWMEGSQ